MNYTIDESASYSSYPGYEKSQTVQTLEDLIVRRKESVMDEIERNISEDLNENMGKEIIKKIIIKFGIDINELRAEIVTEEI